MNIHAILFFLALFLIAIASIAFGHWWGMQIRLPELGRPQGLPRLRVAESVLSRCAVSITAIVLSAVLAWPLCHYLGFSSARGITARAVMESWFAVWAVAFLCDVIEAVIVETSVSLYGSCKIPNVIRGLCRTLILVGAFCLILRLMLNYNVNVLLTSTAIVTGVIGLAMQGVVGSLLSGLSINTVRMFGLGDCIKVGEYEGIVRQINWRETRLETGSGNVVIIPNSAIANATVTNYYMNHKPSRLSLDISANYDSEPEKVIAQLVEAALEHPYVFKKPAPYAYITAFDDVAINYRLYFWVEDYFNYPRYCGELNQAIWYKFQRNGIQIPFPFSATVVDRFLAAANRMQQLAPPAPEGLEQLASDILGTKFFCKVLVDNATNQPLLTRELLSPALPFIKRVLYSPGEALFKQGVSDDQALYLIIRGAFRGTVNHGDGKSTNFLVNSGEVLGEMGLLTGAPRSATVIADGFAQLIKIPPSAFAPLVDTIPALREKLGEIITARQSANEKNAHGNENPSVASALVEERLITRFRRFLHTLTG